MLLKNGADIEATVNSLTPLMLAIQYGYAKIVELLLNVESITLGKCANAKINAQDSSGTTALLLAIELRSLELLGGLEMRYTKMVRYLLAHGVDTNIVRRENSSPYKFDDFQQGNSALHFAIRMGGKGDEVVSMLLDYNVDVNI
jgi:ankyrin repeat protein